MTDAFDPYYVWLGIPPAEQPANHYRLLAINLFESNEEVIENAADQRMVHLRTFQIGKQSEISQRLLNEVAVAKVCLLRPEKKAAYDEQLRRELQAKAVAAEDQRPELDSQLTAALQRASRGGRGHSRGAPPPGRGAMLGAAAAVAALALIVAVWALAPRKAPVQPAAARTTGLPAPVEPGKPAGQAASPAPHRADDAAGPQSPAPNPPSPLPGAAAAIPPLAKPLMSTAEAAAIQKQWAAHLGRPVLERNSLGMPLVLIPPGEFDMGSTPEEHAWALAEGKKNNEAEAYLRTLPSESPRHRVRIGRPFYLGVYVVTQAEYEKVMGVNPSTYSAKPLDGSAFKPPLSEEQISLRNHDCKMVAGRDTSRYPAETVTFDDTIEFCRRLSSMPAERGGGSPRGARGVYRLPTEAEWEYACRAGTTTRWYCGDEGTHLVDVAWFNKNSGGTTHPVGQKRSNAWGLYDMYGNVWQRCADRFGADYYMHSPPSDPVGPAAGTARVARGGYCNNFLFLCRSAYRYQYGPSTRTRALGFRVALDLGIASETAGLPAPERPSKAGGESKHDQGAAATSPSPAANPKAENRPPLLPVPADDVRDAAAKPAQDVYRNEYASAKSPVAKRALARRILDDALKVRDDAVKRYVLCCLARDVAIAGQDERLAIESVEELRRVYAVDAWAMKLDTVGRLATGARPAATRGDLARLALTLAEEAVQADEVSAADELTKLALAEASKARDRALVTRAHAAAKKTQELLKVSSTAEAARAQLKANPDDAAAHLTLGRYLCLAKGDWEAGLPHLARGDDAELKALADDDLKHIPPPWRPEAGGRPPAPVPAAAAMKLADAWWDRAEKASGRERECMLLRAGSWCEEVATSPEAAQYSSTLDLRRRALAKEAIEVPHKTVMVNSLGMPLVLIPAGRFEMGSTAEQLAWATAAGKRDKAVEWYFERVSHEVPRHRVEISKPFYLGMYPVTQAEYEKVMGVNPSAFTARQMPDSAFKTPQPAGYLKLRGVCRQRAAGKDTSRCPVESVAWDDAMEFCHRLSAMPGERWSGADRAGATGRVYRLPTEAEWEYACRAGTTTHWYCGDDETRLAEVAWFAGNSEGITHPVGQKRPNAWGLFDMHGNVMQWCADFYGPDYYSQSPHNDPDGPTSAADHVLRGGCRANRAAICRSAFRNHAGPIDHSFDFGFRVVVELVRDESVGIKPAEEAARSQPAAQTGIRRARKRGGVPPPAQPSMAAGEAAQVQQQWAQYLGMAVEETNSLGMPLVLIPPGGFQMGAAPEEIAWAAEHSEKNPQNQQRLASEAPRHRVQITRPFYLAKNLVTQGEFAKLMGVNPSAFAARQIDPSAFPRPLPEGELKIRQVDANKVAGKDTSRHPVETVTWQEAVEFCRRLSALPAERAAKRTYRLPSEAEWEYACRAGTTTRWYPGDDPDGLADASWFKENSGGTTHPVGEKKPNAWGLCDMQGNVRQWCADWFAAESYQQSPASDPAGPPSGTYRVLRGGFCRNDPPVFRSAARFYSTPAARGHAFGFRVVAER